MLFDVVRLRSKGVKLSRAELAAVRPVRGELSLWQLQNLQTNRPYYSAALTMYGDPSSHHLIPVLDPARVKTIKRNALLVIGIEQVEYRRVTTRYPQAWWCTLPSAPVETDVPTYYAEEFLEGRAEIV